MNFAEYLSPLRKCLLLRKKKGGGTNFISSACYRIEEIPRPVSMIYLAHGYEMWFFLA